MIQLLLKTDPSLVPLVLRLTLAVIVFPHGAQKLFGWFGGYGFRGTMRYFTSMGLPAALGVLVILTESIGAVALAVGLFGRIAALGVACVMVGAIALVHLRHGFFMNWFGNQQGEGYEYHLLMAAIAVALVITGSGLWSLDGLLAR
ncbi:MAG: DoxX family protein [Burkholderiales bacterium]